MTEQIEHNQTVTPSRDSPVILHLSDLHFGSDDSRQAEADRHVVLDNLVSSVAELRPDWKPTTVCITGDITWKGQQRGYDIAKPWLEELLRVLRLPATQVIICPGNHDSIRVRALPRAADAGEADKVLTLDRLAEYEKVFEGYIEFCKRCGFPGYTLYDQESHVAGQRLLANIRFVVCNSAWFCRDNNDEGQLWLGLRLLQAMRLPLSSDRQAMLTVSLLHHPPEFLHISDRGIFQGRAGAFPYLVERSHLILSGHTHELPAPPDIKRLRVPHIRVGSAYEDVCYPNTFCLIRIEEVGLCYHYYRTEPESPSKLWRAEGDPVLVKFPWISDQLSASTGAAQQDAGHVAEDIADRVQLCGRQVEDGIAQILGHLANFDYSSMFDSADKLEVFVESHKSLIPKELLLKAYVQLGDVEATRVNLESARSDAPKDFSKAWGFLEKAKNVGAE